MRTSRVVALAAACCAAVATAGPAGGSDWPQFLGPDRNGQSKETGLARKWPPGGPRVIWTVRVGDGFAGPSVRDGKVYILDRKGGKNDAKDGLRVFDFASGRELWKFVYDAPGRFAYKGSRSTPTVDENNVYIVGSMGHFHCISKRTHRPVWKKNLLGDFGGKRPMWAVTQSPVLYKDTVIVAPQKRAGVIACDRATGKIIWRSPPNNGMSYASPSIMTIGGVDQVVMLSHKGTVSGVDARSGKALWTYNGWSCRIPVPSPVSIGDGRIFITGGYDAGSAMIKVARRGTGFAVTELYKTDAMGSHIHPPLLYEGHLYANSNDNTRRDGLMCMDLDGNVKWKTGMNPNFERGGLILAEGMIYIIDGKSAAVHLVEATPEGYRLLARAGLLAGKGGKAWGPVVLCDGKLLIRDQRELKCLDVKGR